MSTPRASIVTTVRGTPAELVAISIDSLLEQSEPAVEVVVVCDGPPADDLDDLLREVSGRDERVVVLRPGRVGRGQALNLGLEAARADLVGIQDADDASHRDRIATQVALLDAHPEVSLLGTGAKVRRTSAGVDWDVDTAGASIRVLDMELLRSNPLIHSTVLARASALAGIGGYDAGRTAQLDYDLLLRLRARGEVIATCALPLVLHRYHPAQNYEGMSPSSRAWSSYRLQAAHVGSLPPAHRAGYHGIAATRLVYQVARGLAWHRTSRRQRSSTPPPRPTSA